MVLGIAGVATVLEHEDGSTGDSSIEGLDAESREALDVTADAQGD